MSQSKEKRCRVCGTTDNLAIGAFKNKQRNERTILNLCIPCRNDIAREAAQARVRDYCSRCYDVKTDANTNNYCKPCSSKASRRIIFRKMSDDFKIDLHIYVEAIKRRDYNLYDIDLLKIVDLWCQICYFPHMYWANNTADQLRLMFKDLERFLTDETLTNGKSKSKYSKEYYQRTKKLKNKI